MKQKIKQLEAKTAAEMLDAEAKINDAWKREKKLREEDAKRHWEELEEVKKRSDAARLDAEAEAKTRVQRAELDAKTRVDAAEKTAAEKVAEAEARLTNAEVMKHLDAKVRASELEMRSRLAKIEAAASEKEKVAAAAKMVDAEVRSVHWSPYDRVGVVNADP